jgi:hypothetical protein
MIRISLILALGVMLGFAMPGSDNAKAASAISSPALALGQHVTGVQRSNIANADVSFRLYIGPRYRRYRHYRRYRRYRRPGVRLYIRPRYRSHRRYRRYRGRSCSYWSRRCARNWGFGNSNYYGCMRYHGCR